MAAKQIMGSVNSLLRSKNGSRGGVQQYWTLFKRKKIKYENSIPSRTSGYRFEDYKVGYNIGKGCNAAVYKAFIPEVPKTKASDTITKKEKAEVVNRQAKSAARGQCVSGEDSEVRKKISITQENSSLSFVILKKETLTDSLRACEGDTSNPLRASGGGSSYPLRAFEEDTNYPLKVPEGETSYPLALKMLWNINAGSSSDAILTSMVKELVPTIPNALIGEFGGMKGKKMKPHPNIIQVVRAFVDSVPLLPGAWMEYPDVLPTRLNPCGLGYNHTLFLVMKSYPCTLQQYLQVCIPNKECATVMILQLLEGVDHLVQHGIAHRDLKSDNILVEFDSVGCPRLVITDFGCCLAEESLGLKLPFTSNDVNRGGNICLMAPEISAAIPGPGVIIDYNKSDAWSVGTLAYEILGLRNPFYGYGMDYLESWNYQEDKLPPLPGSIHRDVRLVVKRLLCRDPKRRLSARVAADMLHLHLWGPELLASTPITVENVFRWLRCQTLLTLLQVSMNHKLPVEIELKRSFLANLSFEELRLGLDLLLHVKT
ncbi:serine/threonine-protein kinase PINK1, mitochondrial isoform X2 [Rhincodon typus]|uniref:serine/threonine-protein kinase PINK1, mitochondrial isoform X2 n=1 Tax=Rhincodon typus TaxID=259920 RepID=UPI00202F2978|nr:serine/threonine-protein kinase PINK1, mitochondrial isoform X2 [Rhincodon typus]